MAELDPVLTAVAAGAQARPATFAGTPDEARARVAAAINSNRDPESAHRVERISTEFAVEAGHRVALRVCWPKAVARYPIVVFAHGGGYTLLSAELSDDICTRLSERLGALVVAVDYRLAPEHPFPAAIHDLVTATRWVAREAAQLGGDETQIVLMGESAGANIAASTALLLAGEVALGLQVLVVPSPDFAAASNLIDVPGSMLRASDMAIFRRYYFGDDLAQAAAFPASAAASPDLNRAPDTVIALAGYDPTAHIGEAYAARLAAEGVAVEVLRFPTMFHPFLGFAHISDGAGKAFDAICQAIRTRITPASTTSSQPTVD